VQKLEVNRFFHMLAGSLTQPQGKDKNLSELIRKMKRLDIRGFATGFVLKVFICGLLFLLAGSSPVHASTFAGTSTLAIDGTFTDWGTPDSPVIRPYLPEYLPLSCKIRAYELNPGGSG
jgi:hypothetical protein